MKMKPLIRAPRMVTETHTTYQSRPFRRKLGWHGYGVPLLADFGEARLGDEHEGLIQPDIYRAPEVILGSRWHAKVDVWNVGVMVYFPPFCSRYTDAD